MFDNGLLVQPRSSLNGKRFAFEGFGVSPNPERGPEWRLVCQFFLASDEFVLTLGHLKKKDVQISERRKTLGSLIAGEMIAPIAVRNARGAPDAVKKVFGQAKQWMQDLHPDSKWYWRT
jgi:hypothetical protein